MLKEIFQDSLKISKITMIWFDFFKSELFLFFTESWSRDQVHAKA